MTTRSRLVALALVAMLSLGIVAGCAKKAPQLTSAQLAAGVTPPQHPVSQAEAQKQGCNCHVQQQ